MRLALIALLGPLAACTTPYNPPVVVRDSAPFPGIAGIIAENGKRPVDILLVHGMCTHTADWADSAINTITGAVDANAGAAARSVSGAATNRVQVVERTRPIGGGTAHFHALIWSPLTADLKHQLEFDMTKSPTDCTTADECKPTRARFNGLLKDQLMNDCLADAVVYAGASHPAIKQAMVDTVAQVLEKSQTEGADGPLIVVAESLGTKLLFDALSVMLQPDAPPRLHQLGQNATRRMALIFMTGNQLPMLGLAEQGPVAMQAQAQDSLQRFLALRRQQAGPRAETSFSKLAVVAFTDPNDVLSYRLLPSRYKADDVTIADILTSNASTWFGLLQDPFAAHLNYLSNPGVGTLVACGWPKSAACH
ncbi:hypothetical protein [Massilia horti]|uniref:Uncharacterized protein n=1 Tax=Massilia horti TaxID=2562153 RepID=A0A4Y9SZC1_9BURK|nr:hypothetical protein [Massilia horti]TFW30497.1 hypothetical protein E4O92_16400 [Massilia horti]TFW30584.1 hypothetical protein E4O92_16885 [Massilia horti]